MRFLPLIRRFTVELPLFASRVPAGFPSPAEDYIERALDLNEHVIQHPAATYFVRASGESMMGVGIFNGDLLIVDRARAPQDGDVVIAAVAGELTCKVLDLRQRRLLSASAKFKPIPIAEDMELVIEGVVTHSLRYHRAGV